MSWRLVVLGVLVLAIDTTLATSCPQSPQHVQIPNSFTEIVASAYAQCPNVLSLDFEANSTLKTIGNYSFFQARDLTGNLTIPSSVTEIGIEAFRETAITGLKFEANSVLKTIGTRSFNQAVDLTGNLTIPSTVTEIGDGAFYETAITGLSFEANSNLVTIGQFAFAYASNLAGSLTIPSSVKTTGSQAFASTAITSLSFEANSILETIGQFAFAYASNLAGSLTIPSSVTEIGNGAFFYTKITSVTIPDSVKFIGTNVFTGCTHLSRVIVSGDNNLLSGTSSSNLVETLCSLGENSCIEGNGNRASNIINHVNNTCGLNHCGTPTSAPTSPPTSAPTSPPTSVPTSPPTSAPRSTSADSDTDDDTLGVGAIVGISLGGAALLGGIVWFLRHRMREPIRARIAHATVRVGELFF